MNECFENKVIYFTAHFFSASPPRKQRLAVTQGEAKGAGKSTNTLKTEAETTVSKKDNPI